MPQHRHFPTKAGRRSIKAFFTFLNPFYTYSVIIDRKSKTAHCDVCNQLICEPKGTTIYSRFAPLIVVASVFSGVFVYYKTHLTILAILGVYLTYSIPYAFILLFGNWTTSQNDQESETACKKRLSFERKEAEKDIILSWSFWAQFVLSIAALFFAVSVLK